MKTNYMRIFSDVSDKIQRDEIFQECSPPDWKSVNEQNLGRHINDYLEDPDNLIWKTVKVQISGNLCLLEIWKYMELNDLVSCLEYSKAFYKKA